MFPKACEGCKGKCPFQGNEAAFTAIDRRGWCPHNPKKDEKVEEKRSMGWKKNRNK